ncbi:hypothetical protein DFH27DRAFT_99902 [Peziza echinospora]|nr:hypothetical protein DFH27DRAFT_99902 [Peziza echinospora]
MPRCPQAILATLQTCFPTLIPHPITASSLFHAHFPSNPHACAIDMRSRVVRSRESFIGERTQRKVEYSFRIESEQNAASCGILHLLNLASKIKVAESGKGYRHKRCCNGNARAWKCIAHPCIDLSIENCACLTQEIVGFGMQAVGFGMQALPKKGDTSNAVLPMPTSI